MVEKYKSLLKLFPGGLLPDLLQGRVLYDYSVDKPNELFFDELYLMSDDYLQAKSQEHSFPPSYLLIQCSYDINGAAGTRPAGKVMLLNDGFVTKLLPTLKRRERIYEGFATKKMKDISIQLKKSFAEISVKYLWAFSTYHEMAHLLEQREQEVSTYTRPIREVSPIEITESLASELAADIFAIGELVADIVSQIESIYKKPVEDVVGELEGLIKIALSGIFYFMINEADLYEHIDIDKPSLTYPHPLVRIYNFSKLFLSKMSNKLSASASFNGNKVLDDVFTLTEKILEDVYGPRDQRIQDKINKREGAMDSYLQKVIEKITNMPELSRNYVSP